MPPCTEVVACLTVFLKVVVLVVVVLIASKTPLKMVEQA